MKNIYIFNINFYLGQVFLPYVYGCLRSYCENIEEIKNNYLWKEPIYDMEEPETILSRLDNPSVVGFSCYMWNWKKNLFFGREIKKRFPNCLLVLGGPQVPTRDDDFFKQYPWADILVHSEGEIPFSQILLENLKSSPDWNSIPGISWNDNNERIRVPGGSRIEKVIEYKSPYLSGYYESIIAKAKTDHKKITVFWETNRGCPYS